MSEIEKRALEILDKHCPPGDYDYSDVLDAIREALTPDKSMVDMPGLNYSMPKWVLQAALDISGYMDDRHPGDWKIGPIQKRVS